VLVLICGPTGSGKTTLMARLAADRGMAVVATWTTRPRRDSDPYKLSVSAADYAAMAARLFWPAQRLYGHLYGEDYAAVMAAACPRTAGIWLLDMALDTLCLFDRIPHRTLVLLPNDAGFLARTLAVAGRAERGARARAEWAAWQEALDGPRLADARVIACRFGEQAAIERRAGEIIAGWRRAAPTATAAAGSP
jgi:hypothetical protein